jgi:hypothetical protein
MRENAEKALVIKPKSDVATTIRYHFCFTLLFVFVLQGWWWSTLLVAILPYVSNQAQAFLPSFLRRHFLVLTSESAYYLT